VVIGVILVPSLQTLLGIKSAGDVSPVLSLLKIQNIMKVLKFASSLLLLFVFTLSCGDKTAVTADPVVPLSDDELLTKVQYDSFKYFWDVAESNSKLARERFHTDEPFVDANLVTMGGSGFGLMNILVGIERQFITREQAITRLETALTFLETADRFYGAWPHWLNGTTGKTIPFSPNDDGGDLVETAFMCQSLICLREYFKNGTEREQALAAKADALWKGVDWNWYTKGEEVLYWHWSPTNGWIMNFKLEGYNECLITYILAASSPTHPINPQAYHKGWARNGGIVSSASAYDLPIVLKHNGAQTVGPLFWAHYSFMGLDPRGLNDQYANYWTLNKNHTQIMYNYCVANQVGWIGYGENCWGLTASYSRNPNGTVGYTDHKPGNDRGVITPTAALSSFPYTPQESMQALRFFYEDKTWSPKLIGFAGPFDAFSTHYDWVTPRYLAIDQGTIAPMIENYRTGLLWNLFMQAPEIRQGLIALGFSSSQHAI
jgi:hypothetical protein